MLMTHPYDSFIPIKFLLAQLFFLLITIHSGNFNLQPINFFKAPTYDIYTLCCVAEIANCSLNCRAMEMEEPVCYDNDLNLKATELRLGLPGTHDQPVVKRPSIKLNKRNSSEVYNSSDDEKFQESRPSSKAQVHVVGWPPVRSYRKNVFQQKKNDDDAANAGMYLKVSMDGAPYLRKIDLKIYNNYTNLLKALENMFKCSIGVYSEREGYNGSVCALTYEDKDGDWMLAGDVPWDMFITSCKRLRIMEGSEANKGLGCI